MRAFRTPSTERLVRTAAWAYLVPRFLKTVLVLSIVAFAAFLLLTQFAVRALQ